MSFVLKFPGPGHSTHHPKCPGQGHSDRLKLWVLLYIYGLVLKGIKCIKYVCLSDVFESPSHSTVNALLSVLMTMCLGRNKLSL